MENANSPEYLEKIKAAVMENLRHTVPVPSVQMQDIPPSFGAMTDEEEAELDDLNEDMNKDVRVTQRDTEKRIVHGAEFEDSDDEEGAIRPNGTRAGAKRQFTDFKNDDGAADSGSATPANQSTTAAEPAEVEDPDVTIEDAGISAPAPAAAEDKPARAGSPPKKTKTEDEPVAAADAAISDKDDTEKEKEKEKGAEAQHPEADKEDKPAEKEAEKPVDADGDIGMEDAVVKKEDEKQ